jgi:hypothetical protein
MLDTQWGTTLQQLTTTNIGTGSLQEVLMGNCSKDHFYVFQLLIWNMVYRFMTKFKNQFSRYKGQYSKRTKVWRPVAVLQKKENAYLPELIVKIFRKRLDVHGPVTQKLGLALNDPRNITQSIAPTPRQPMEQLLARHRSRYSEHILWLSHQKRVAVLDEYPCLFHFCDYYC